MDDALKLIMSKVKYFIAELILIVLQEIVLLFFFLEAFASFPPINAKVNKLLIIPN